MIRVVRRTIVPGILLGATLVGSPGAVSAASPRIMMFYGHGLAKAVVLSNWRDTSVVIRDMGEAPRWMHPRLRGRPSFRVAMFWGPEWMRYMSRHRSAANVRPSQANQFARFYPAHGSAQPLFVFDSIPGPYNTLIRVVGRFALSVLAQHGVPVRLSG